MDAITLHTEKPLITLAKHKGTGSKNRASMLDLALLLKQCGTSESNTKELISFVDDINDETGEVTTVKVVF